MVIKTAAARSTTKMGVRNFCHLAPRRGAASSVSVLGGSGFGTGAGDPGDTGDVDIKVAPWACRDLEGLELSRLGWSNCGSTHDDED
jgi:hypothetical protein